VEKHGEGKHLGKWVLLVTIWEEPGGKVGARGLRGKKKEKGNKNTNGLQPKKTKEGSCPTVKEIEGLGGDFATTERKDSERKKARGLGHGKLRSNDLRGHKMQEIQKIT